MTRTAISPRFAISTLENTSYGDPMDTARAKSVLAGRRFGSIEWLESTGSTNSDLLERARQGVPEQVLGARHQEAGRGRMGRVWSAPPDASLLCSILVRPALPPAEIGAVTMALGLAAAEACDQSAGVGVGLKWPNDLVVVAAGPDGADLKLSGILAESVVVGGRVEAVVAGIGINVDWPEPLPDELAGMATSLRQQRGAPVDATDLLVTMLVGFEQRLGTAERAGAAGLLDEYRNRSATIGRRVRVELPGSELIGTAVDVTPTGALIVEDAEGDRREVAAGDVVHLRPLDVPGRDAPQP